MHVFVLCALAEFGSSYPRQRNTPHIGGFTCRNSSSSASPNSFFFSNSSNSIQGSLSWSLGSIAICNALTKHANHRSTKIPPAFAWPFPGTKGATTRSLSASASARNDIRLDTRRWYLFFVSNSFESTRSGKSVGRLRRCNRCDSPCSTILAKLYFLLKPKASETNWEVDPCAKNIRLTRQLTKRSTSTSDAMEAASSPVSFCSSDSRSACSSLRTKFGSRNTSHSKTGALHCDVDSLLLPRALAIDLENRF
mmetsp:Transcript_7762/g.11128  ORF Transcript_7762/g.11128 Transcript_7762/m.11128 type:complete len:252 (+) Transcript_7762:983-1738(+)